MHILRFAALLSVATTILSGCSSASSDYACKGLAEGVNCVSARDVYQMTDDPNFQTQLQKENAAKARKKAGDDGASDDQTEGGTVVLREVPGEQYVTPRPARNPLPIRTPATVMRIGFAPWEDEKGDLNVPGYIYTEIAPRRWEVGVERPPETPTLHPLQVQAVPTTQMPSAKAAPNQSAAEIAKSARRNAQSTQ
ncbi:type IV conjugative transfer system lipoprotein TraV [Pseudomonas sp. R5(2019)]|uniref:type IV conjugative transfer system lipoprotein TraV n=1 Tax=Pseudomonas sp. R5(2019) TaxID=2697566 RepID=UPI001412025F|nr:type IV conjugative transfer system lipoprotein TraV [Pseudomonas sp. R5(2019)]NBA95295.1 type IV conjugative transfer system lipoprotein TraV [Pseudomonas sp. R5(2019)]